MHHQSPKTSPARTRAAFTVMELIVAVTILTVILSATAVIWSSQRTIIQIASAQTEVSPYGRALESNLRRDLQGLSRDGFMVISTATGPEFSGEPTHTYFYDQLLFFANGLKTSVSTPGVNTLTSRVWYGHLNSSDWSNTPAWRFSLGRQDLLLNPGAAGATSLTDPAIANGTIDYLNSDLLTLKQSLFSGTPAANMAATCFRITGQRYTDFSTGGTLMDIHALMAPFCSTFHVQFAGRYNPAVTPVGQVDTNAGQIAWYGYDDNGNLQTPTLPPGNSQVVNTSTFVFSPDQPDTWPTLIQVTVDLHDSNGHFHDHFKKKPTDANGPTIDGYRYRFIIKL